MFSGDRVPAGVGSGSEMVKDVHTDRQPQPRALRLGRVERLEQAQQMLRRAADTAVGVALSQLGFVTYDRADCDLKRKIGPRL